MGRGTFEGQNWLIIVIPEPEHSLHLITFCSSVLSILRSPKSVKMRRAPVSEVDSRVEADKHIKYKGTARVRLNFCTICCFGLQFTTKLKLCFATRWPLGLTSNRDVARR